MRIPSSPGPRRQGSIAPMTCVLLVIILGMVAFAVDISWLALTESELQNAADSAALAGANRLGDNYVLWNLPGQSASNRTALYNGAISAAKLAAKTYAASNTAGGVGNLTLLDSDIDVGFLNSSGNFVSSNSSNANYPNTVKVTMRRDSSANTPLDLFFAPVIGTTSMNLTAKSGATLYGGQIINFKVGTGNSGMLPVTYDVSYWNGFLSNGRDPDGNARTDSDSYPVLQVYPSIKVTGNFGLLSLDDSHVGASTVSNWISNGISPSEIQTLRTNNLIPVTSHNALLWDWAGENGFKSSNVQDMNAQVGKTFILPLFQALLPAPLYTPGVGQGSNYDFNIVQFVGVKIMPPSDTNRQVWVQPAVVDDPNMILNPNTIAPIGSNSIFYTSYAGARLTD